MKTILIILLMITPVSGGVYSTWPSRVSKAKLAQINANRVAKRNATLQIYAANDAANWNYYMGLENWQRQWALGGFYSGPQAVYGGGGYSYGNNFNGFNNGFNNFNRSVPVSPGFNQSGTGFF